MVKRQYLKPEEYGGYKIWFEKIGDRIHAKVWLDGIWYEQAGETKKYAFNRIKQVINHHNRQERLRQNPNLLSFKDDLKQGKCPFCGEKLEYYDGALGYEAMKCPNQHITIDHRGIHIEDE